MQEEFIGNIHDLRERGATRALLISATGERDIFMTGERNIGSIRVSGACPKYVRGNLIGIFTG